MGKKEKKKRKKLHEFSPESDIKYKGPLSYRHLRIIGWIGIAAMQVLVLVALSDKIAPGQFKLPGWLFITLNMLGQMTLPLFILANFSLILDIGNGYKKQMITNGLAAGGIAAVTIFLYLRYGIGIAAYFLGSREAASQTLDQLFAYAAQKNAMGFNIFVDMLLCTLLTFFLNYRPRKFFTGKRLIIFRLFSIFPVLYEVASIVLKYLTMRQVIALPVIIYPFLTTKPVMIFIAFLVLSFIIKNRERLYCKYGKTHEEYLAFLRTNRNSLHFSIFTAITFAVVGLIDTMLYAILMEIQAMGAGQTMEILQSMGIGTGTSSILVLSPFILLFSYTRRHRNKLPDTVIPVGGIVLIVIIYLEGLLIGIKQFFVFWASL